MHGFSQTHKKVYFVGNSYTGTNNLPNLIKSVAQSTQNTFYFESHTPGGSTLQQHANNQTVLNKINQGDWDYVVLQEQSQLPSFPISQVQNQVFAPAASLALAIKNANPCTMPLFYMTWGHKFGDQNNCNNGLTYVCTYEGMDNALYNRYMQMAQSNQSLISPVGKVWREIRTQHPELELYTSDNSHPSLLGSLAAAYTFFAIIYQQDPTSITYNAGLPEQQTSILKNIVKNVVFDHLENWFVGVHDNATNFEYNNLGNATFNFSNLTPNATEYVWDFGDGNTSTLANPRHTYQQNGNYTVTLTTNSCNNQYTKSKEIIITTLSNPSIQDVDVKIYPNPTNSVVYIQTQQTDTKVALFTIDGKKIQTSPSCSENNIAINLSNLSNGIYILQISQALKNKTIKLIKN